jgi:hypothetical protein
LETDVAGLIAAAATDDAPRNAKQRVGPKWWGGKAGAHIEKAAPRESELLGGSVGVVRVIIRRIRCFYV